MLLVVSSVSLGGCCGVVVVVGVGACSVMLVVVVMVVLLLAIKFAARLRRSNVPKLTDWLPLLARLFACLFLDARWLAGWLAVL